MPVATTETRILPPRSLLNAEPQMMFASGSTSSLMWLAASSTSIRRMSSPPVIEMITPLAPFMLTPSSSGLEIAFSAASIALLEHLVGHFEGFLEGRFRIGEPEQILVGNDDQSVDVLLKLGKASFGRAGAPRAFECERLGAD